VWSNNRIGGKTKKCLYLYGKTGCGKSKCVEGIIRGTDDKILLPVPGHFFGQNLGKYNSVVVLFIFSFESFKSNFATLKRLMEGKRFSVDVKCEDPLMV
jgi:energy-coupling factor transporter ATP-binding protein EcfA2